MRAHIGIAAAVLALLSASSSAAQSAAPHIDTLAIRAHTRFLADDQLLGRGTGTEGERIAAAYIASQLHRLGLTPLRDTSFLLPVPLRAAHVSPASSVTVTGGHSSSFRSGADFLVNTGGAGAFTDFRGRALFFGQPVHASAIARAERSLVGRVAVFFGPLGANAVDLVPALAQAGAAGIVLLVPDPAQFDLYTRSRGDTRFFAAAAVDDPVWQPELPVLIAGPAMSEALLDGVDIPSALMDGTATRPVDLERTISAHIDVSTSDVAAANVGAVLRGSDSARAGQYVVFTAHFDHLGVSVPDAAGDSIYNGFSDNAAGVAMLLAMAQAVRDAPPARSVVFLFFTGEERGLLGSSYLAAASPIALDSIAALINLDAGAPPAPPISWRIAGGEDTPLGETARVVAERHGWTAALSAATPNSDYWPFLRRGVPSIFIIPGNEWENVTPEQRAALRRRWDRYHRADDHWHSEFPFSGLQRYAQYALLVGMEIANRRNSASDAVRSPLLIDSDSAQAPPPR